MDNILEGREGPGCCHESHMDTGLAPGQKVLADFELSKQETGVVRTCHPVPSHTCPRERGGSQEGDEAWGCYPFLPLNTGLVPHQSELDKKEGWYWDDTGNEIHHFLECCLLPGQWATHLISIASFNLDHEACSCNDYLHLTGEYTEFICPS